MPSHIAPFLLLALLLTSCSRDEPKHRAGPPSLPHVRRDTEPADEPKPATEAKPAAEAEPGAEAELRLRAGVLPIAPRGTRHLRGTPRPKEEEPSGEHVGRLAADGQAFAFALLREVARRTPGENLVFSPHGIAGTLALAYAGARGQTERAMAKSLRFSLPQSQLHEAFEATRRALETRETSDAALRSILPEDAETLPFRLTVHSAVFLREGLTPPRSYLDTLSRHHGTMVSLASFRDDPERVRAAINDWVAERTEQLFPAILPSGALDASTQMVLLNSVYFSASWQSPFDPESTRPAPFTRLDGTKVEVPMMSDRFHHLPYAEGAGYEAVALPYASSELAFIAIVPQPGAYGKVEATLDARELASLRSRLTPAIVNLTMPKLDFRSQVPLKPALSALGMVSAFEPSADFSGIARVKPLYVSDVRHEAVLKVFEDGTVAAAATASFLVGGAAEDSRKAHTLRIDRPYLFAILDQPTGQLLFLGRVLDPSK